MKKFLENLKNKFGKDSSGSDREDDFVELETSPVMEEKKAKIVVRPFTIDDFSDIKPILDAIREGYTIALVNIHPLKEKDLVELKRAINKLKKTTDAVEGDIAGFGDDWIVITPNFAQIYRNKQTAPIVADSKASASMDEEEQ